MNDLELKNFTIGNNEPMTLMGGVNVLESRDLAMQVAEKFKDCLLYTSDAADE